MSTRPRTLYVSDLDGTLMQPDATLSAETVRLLNDALDRGVLFTIATARTPATIAPIFKDVRLRLPAVVMTGAVLWNPVSDTFSDPRFIAPDTLSSLLPIYRRSGLPAFLFTLRRHDIEVFHLGPLNDMERTFINERKDSPYKHFSIPASGNSILPDRIENAMLFYSMQPTGQVAPVFEQIRDIGGCNPVFYHDIYGDEIAMLEVFSDHSSKALALRTLADRLGVDRIVVFGDNINDISMFRIADEAIAVANAHPEAMAAATKIIGPNTEDSVARYISENA